MFMLMQMVFPRDLHSLIYVGTICDISDFDNAFGIVETKYYSCIEPVYNEALKYVLTNLV